jgi:hypothetical protein
LESFVGFADDQSAFAAAPNAKLIVWLDPATLEFVYRNSGVGILSPSNA